MATQYFSKGESSHVEESQPTHSGPAVVFKYEELKDVTNNFSKEIGRGATGIVYSGRLKDGRMVAVKKLFVEHMRRSEVAEQLLNEIRIHSNLCHKNLVQLYGSTNPEDEKLLLVFELVPNGTLADHLRGKRGKTLSWDQRINIAIETAEALSFLYNSPNPPITHIDVKTETILLDDNFNVKLADFGKSLLGSGGFSPHVSTMDDRNFILTARSDTCSFGVVLLELITGKAAVDVERDRNDLFLVTMARNKIKNNLLEQLVDPELGYDYDERTRSMINGVAKLALDCIRDKGEQGRFMMQYFVELLKDIREPVPPLQKRRRRKQVPKKDLKLSMPMESGPKCSKDLFKVLPEEESEPIDFNSSYLFKYEDLQKATQFFNPSEVIGKGGYGVVYRGKLENGLIVAVKELTKSHPEQIEEFVTEVWVLSGLRHKNLVRLYGCTCQEDEKLLLVYELVTSGTVAHHLRHRREESLSWAQRIKVAIDTAKAIAYLHSFKPAIIHRDIKTENLLLDKDFNVKLADFGMCCLLPPSVSSHISTVPKGTQGYLDPEYSELKKVTTKNDVYCFGVVLLELISGKAALDIEGDDIWLVNVARDIIKNNLLEQLVDPNLEYGSNKEIDNMITSVAQLASRCLQLKGVKRPSMLEALMILKDIGYGKQQAETTSSSLESLSVAFEALENALLASYPIPPMTVNPRLPISNEDSRDSIHVSTEEEWQTIYFYTPCIFEYEEIEEATNFFNPSQVIGEGGYGIVFRGKLKNGLRVAVKRVVVHHPDQRKQYLNEIWVLYALRHMNLMTIYGYTNPGFEELCLVNEFLPNGTVADHLLRKREDILSWEQRIKIAIQAANLLVYLHSLPTPIIHCDFKTDKLWLDNNFNVKVGDFSRCQLLPSYGSSDISLLPQGFQEYQDPEFQHLNKATRKNDVNSFGVVLVELLTGKTALDPQLGTNNKVNIQWINSMLPILVDQELRGHFKQVTALADLAKRCLQFEEEKTPSMSEILIILKDIRDMEQDPTTSMEFLTAPDDVLRNALFTSYHNAAQVEETNDTVSSVIDDATGDIINLEYAEDVLKSREQFMLNLASEM